MGAAVVGDMSSRPYWGLYELDFVFSTIIVSPQLHHMDSVILQDLARMLHGAAQCFKIIAELYIVDAACLKPKTLVMYK